ncbi:hypothetical protein [Streptomyces fumanus]|nr:hypothetical protein [Streptomyces fumanus]
MSIPCLAPREDQQHVERTGGAVTGAPPGAASTGRTDRRSGSAR